MRRMWYICCRLPCPSCSVLTELPFMHLILCVCVCHCDRLIKSVVVILSSLMTSLVDGSARAFTSLSSLDITNLPSRCLETGRARARENKPTVLRKQANAGDVRRIAQLTDMFVCPSLCGLYNGNVIRVSRNR